MRVVSLITKKKNNNLWKSGASKDNVQGYRELTFTSKNEFYVIDINKTKKGVLGGYDDMGISMADIELEHEAEVVKPDQLKGFQLNTIETFQLNIA